MIQLSNGHRLDYVAASGALAFDGRGWPWEWPLRWIGLLDPCDFTVVIKTLTRQPRQGNLRWWNPCGAVRLLRGGVVNAIGLTNPGIDAWCRTIGPKVAHVPHTLIGSIHGDSPEEYAEMSQMLASFPLVGLELNLSCPNTTDNGRRTTDDAVAIVSAVRRVAHLPLILKLGVTHDYVAIAKATQGQVEAIAINSVPWATAYREQRSPLARLGGGGVSGRAAQAHTWRMVEALAKASSTPVIGPGVWVYDDIERVRNLGAKAVSFGSIFLRYPWRPTRFVRRARKEHAR